MSDETRKEGSVINAETWNEDMGEDEVSIKKGTPEDQHAMWRMGKVQEMRVSSSQFTVATSYACLHEEA
jgi:hypothetical protein